MLKNQRTTLAKRAELKPLENLESDTFSDALKSFQASLKIDQGHFLQML